MVDSSSMSAFEASHWLVETLALDMGGRNSYSGREYKERLMPILVSQRSPCFCSRWCVAGAEWSTARHSLLLTCWNTELLTCPVFQADGS